MVAVSGLLPQAQRAGHVRGWLCSCWWAGCARDQMLSQAIMCVLMRDAPEKPRRDTAANVANPAPDRIWPTSAHRSQTTLLGTLSTQQVRLESATIIPHRESLCRDERTGSVVSPVTGPYGTYCRYSKELSLRNQPLETQRWILAQFLRNWLAGSETLSF